MKKIFFYYLIVISFLVFLIYIFVGIYGYFDYKRYELYLFENNEDLEFHYKYSNQLNHLRNRKFTGDLNSYLFNYINKSGDEKILLLGDSWFDQINASGYEKSLEELIYFAEKNKKKIINGGISSYSPSLFFLQYKVLKNDFNINPKLLVIHVDQTDIGDENCRYKDKKKYNNRGNLNAVERFDYDYQIFNGIKIYKYSDIKLNSKFFSKIFKLSNFTVEYFFKKNFYRIKQINKNGWKNDDQRSYYKCRFKVIKSFLSEVKKNENDYFQKVLKEFFDYLEKENNLDKIIITTFPHKNHLNGLYKTNVSTIIDETLKDYSDKFYHLDFTNNDINKKISEIVYVENDEASHLNPKFHHEIFIKGIINSLDNLFINSF